MTEQELLADLDERLTRAAMTIDDMVERHAFMSDRARLRGKAQGIRLAQAYLQEMRR